MQRLACFRRRGESFLRCLRRGGLLFPGAAENENGGKHYEGSDPLHPLRGQAFLLRTHVSTFLSIDQLIVVGQRIPRGGPINAVPHRAHHRPQRAADVAAESAVGAAGPVSDVDRQRDAC